MKTMSDIVRAYLFDTRQIDALACRQAAMICRSVANETQRDEITVVTLLALAALQSGSPRVSTQQLLMPLAKEVVAAHAANFRSVQSANPLWLEGIADFGSSIAHAVDTCSKHPERYVPVSGGEPLEERGSWPLLVVKGELFGFSRYWTAAKKLETIHLPFRLCKEIELPDTVRVQSALQQVFALQSLLPHGKTFHYRQIAAAALACRTDFLVISGGPGTGKTSVVLQIIRTLLRVFPHIAADRIVLCAPTGRAKARLGESIDEGRRVCEGLYANTTTSFATSPDGSLGLVTRKTIHSLLGQRPDGTFKYNRENRLSIQVIIVDEVSMVDLNLFAALMDALTENCRIILVGDMHQLPSVEAGAVLGDLTSCFSETEAFASISQTTAAWMVSVIGSLDSDGADDAHSLVITSKEGVANADALVNHAIVLTHSYRSSPTILSLAHAVNQKHVALAMRLLVSSETNGTVTINTTTGIAPVVKWFKEHVRESTIKAAYAILKDDFAGDLSSDCIEAINSVLFTSTVLTLVHDGERGRRVINSIAGDILREWLGDQKGDRFFHGLPVLLGSNHAALDLYNGDIGMVLATREGLKVCFPRGGAYRMVALDRLKDLEEAFALTVHKAQGSEFDKVLLVLPEEDSPILSRQIVYTGITRAKKSLQILGTESVLSLAITRRETRYGGVQVFKEAR